MSIYELKNRHCDTWFENEERCAMQHPDFTSFLMLVRVFFKSHYHDYPVSKKKDT